MKESEVFSKYYDDIVDAMRKAYRSVLNSHGNIQCKIYVWDDGEVVIEDQPQGSNGYLVANEYSSRDLFYVALIEEPCFDPWDCVVDSKPEDEEEALRAEEDIIDWVLEEYNADEILDQTIRQSKAWERDAERYKEED